MTYKFHTRLDLINGGNIFRQDDKITLGYIARNSNGEAIDFSGKEIMGTIYNRRAGIMFEAEASFDAESQKIIFTITQTLDHGTFEIEFVVTDPGDANYRVVVPSDEYSGRLDIKPSSANIEVTGVRMVTVEQLRLEQQAAQAEYESKVDGKIQQYQTEFTTYKEEVDDVLEGHQQQIADEFSGFKDSAAKGKVFGTVDERFEELEKDSYLPAKNDVINGDFSEGTSGWLPNGSNISAMNKEVIVTPGSLVHSVGVFRQDLGSGNIGDKFYFKAELLPKYKNSTLFGFSNGGYATLYPGTENTWNKLSAIVNKTSNTLVLYHSFSSSYTLEDSIKMKNILGINLTSVFGSGNEPTKEEMDTLLNFYPSSWFDGTVNLAENKKLVTFLLNQLRGKANKLQESWVTPTLLNGWVKHPQLPTIRYYKDSFGVVHLSGYLALGALSVTLFILPTGYRPNNRANYEVSTKGSSGTVLVQVNGTVLVERAGTEWVSFDGISFKAEA